ncbi:MULTISPECIES: pilus assembly protein [unclassified Isoptericola]|uniref:pilus assembly protein n=1 Tax=unclassified Isoptericola TaxID=2623355 RepID=UPI002713167E|nr:MULTISPECIES: pilus assembly protein [unclassified Isoptericola]MDO8144381.1 pilus assembly protein [Isoptericola sp. 178]MDO8148235.1 pilus assembly protein [Isoptericola sp. b515]
MTGRPDGPDDPESSPTGSGEEGAAVVEFLGVGVLLLVPLVYLVVTVGQIHAAGFAVEGAARDAARAVVTAESSATGAARARAATEVALADQGFVVDGADVLELECSANPCLTPGATVGVRVRVEVPLPLAPPALQDWVPLSIPVEAAHVAPVEEHVGTRP